MVSEYLGLERNAGLTTALVGAAEVNDLLQLWGEDNLFVLTSGQVPPNPSELLGSEAMKQLVYGLEQTFDVVIIDAPPLLPVTDAAVLAQHVGGVVLVVGAQKLKKHDLEKSLHALELVGANMLGAVLNMLPAKGEDAYTYSYGSTPDMSDTKALRRQRAARNTRDTSTDPRFETLAQNSVHEPFNREAAVFPASRISEP
jgi:capsular exopolysaccharide synthesis family protein